MNRSRTAALVAAVAIASLCAGCSKSLVDRTISALSLAPRVIERHNLPAEDAQRLTDAFKVATDRLREWRDAPKDAKPAALDIARRTFEDLYRQGRFKVANPEAQRWVDSVLDISAVLLGLDLGRPVPRGASPGLSEENVRALEQTMRR